MKDDRLYAKFTLDFPDHPKILCLSIEAKWALVDLTIYSRRHMTDGFISKAVALAKHGLDVCQELASNDAENPSLIEVENGFQIHDFALHQSTRAEIESLTEKRRSAGRKGGQARVKQALKQTASKINPETETETETETKDISSHLRTEPHSEPEPTAAASATPGAQLVRENIRGNHPSATLTALRIQASELLRTGTEPSTVAAALQLWNDKPSVGIGRTILASLCSEVIKTANGAPATGSKPSKLRKTVSLAQRVRAQENAHLATAARLELE